MFNEYIEEQKIVTKILANSIKNNKYSHAYLFELNDYNKADNLIIEFIKHIICFDGKNMDEIQSKNIEKNNHPDFFIVEANKNIIKKEQLINLQKEFSKKSAVDGKRVYLIKDAEKMNSSAYNSILKFIEEPNPNIIAILTTQNIYNLNKTIISRCQVLNFENKRANNTINKYLNEEINLENIYKFITILEEKGKKSIAYTKKSWFTTYVNKENISNVLNIITLIYKDSLNYKIKEKTECLEKNDIIIMLSKQDLNQICAKINIFIKYIELLKFNLNENLFIDKLIIEYGGLTK